VARDGRGELFGAPADVAIVRHHLAASPPPAGPSRLMKLIALSALLSLAVLVLTQSAV
jgi:hypothetical protein